MCNTLKNLKSLEDLIFKIVYSNKTWKETKKKNLPEERDCVFFFFLNLFLTFSQLPLQRFPYKLGLMTYLQLDCWRIYNLTVDVSTTWLLNVFTTWPLTYLELDCWRIYNFRLHFQDYCIIIPLTALLNLGVSRSPIKVPVKFLRLKNDVETEVKLYIIYIYIFFYFFETFSEMVPLLCFTSCLQKKL